MTLDDIYHELTMLATYGDESFKQAATYVMQATQQAQAGQLSTDDLAEILKDTQRQLDVINEMSQLQFKETLNTCISGIMTLLGLVI